MREGKRVVPLVGEPVPMDLVADLILVVPNFAAHTVPAEVRRLGCVLAVAEHTHALVVQTVRLGQVDNVKAHFLAFASVADSKEVPLGVAVGINIVLKHEVVFVLAHLDCNQQISGLKARLK